MVPSHPLGASPVPHFLLDATCRISFWNAACEKLFHLQAGDALGTMAHRRIFQEREIPTLADILIESGGAALPLLTGPARAAGACPRNVGSAGGLCQPPGHLPVHGFAPARGRPHNRSGHGASKGRRRAGRSVAPRGLRDAGGKFPHKLPRDAGRALRARQSGLCRHARVRLGAGSHRDALRRYHCPGLPRTLPPPSL